jgi:hypothetical protein
MATFTTAALAASKYHATMKMEALPKKQSGEMREGFHTAHGLLSSENRNLR